MQFSLIVGIVALATLANAAPNGDIIPVSFPRL